MNIEQAKTILNRQMVSERTPKGRPIHENAIEALEATLQDEANYGSQVVQCESCGFVISILMTQAGCPNCGIEELNTKIVE
jgi:rubrerythrin